MHRKHIISAGKKLEQAAGVLILLHGRGGSAADILSLAGYLHVQDLALRAPEATGNSWYPFSFMAPAAQNEPWLSSALEVVSGLVHDLVAVGIPEEKIFFAGFSQGACLTLEFAARDARNYGGIVAFTGGLIGQEINRENYQGNFSGTPVFIGTSDPDPHVPVERVSATADILRQMGAVVTEKVYPNMGHTITQDEVLLANKLVFDARPGSKVEARV
jgi:phospholipase/carboxylesterase